MFGISRFTSNCMQESAGPGNAIVSTLIQALLTAFCSLSSPEQWPSDYGATALAHGLETFDFVVIGAGTAGSVVASRLSENPKWKVLVLEAGGDPPLESEVPALSLSLKHTNFTWNYFTEADGKSCKAYKNEICYWPRGKMIGGTGGINGMLYVRGNREDYDSWEREGNSQWGWNDVFTVYEKSIQFGMSNGSESRGGTIVNSFGVHYSEIRKMIFNGAQELGVKHLHAFEDGANIGYTEVPGTIESGRRASTGKTYLARSKQRPNLKIIKHALVTKINFDKKGQKAIGVTFQYKDIHELTVSVLKDTILSAGTIDSPKLLMLSGIGPNDHLHEHGIKCIKDSSVGDNLQDHAAIPIFIRIDQSKLGHETPNDQLDAAYNYVINQTGPLSLHGTSTVTGLINSNTTSNSSYPDIMLNHHFMQSGTATLDLWANATLLSEDVAHGIREINKNSHILMVYVALLKPKSTGMIRLNSADPKEPPRLFANYLDRPEDVQTLLRGIRYQMKIIETQAFREQDARLIQINLSECDKFTFTSNEYWKCYMKYMVTTSCHLTSTVKMGPDTDSAAVLDWRLRLKGIYGLRVVDASIMPKVVSANSNAPTIMIAEKASEFIKEDWH